VFEKEDFERWLRLKRLIPLGLLSASIFGSASALKSFRTRLTNRDALSQRTQAIVLAPLLVSLLLIGFGGVYVLIPPFLGGGEPVQKDVWFSKEARAILDSYGLRPDEGASTDKPIKISRLWVLYSRGDLFVFCGEKTCDRAIRISKDWVKAESWPLR
jgi:hypothetical protein